MLYLEYLLLLFCDTTMMHWVFTKQLNSNLSMESVGDVMVVEFIYTHCFVVVFFEVFVDLQDCIEIFILPVNICAVRVKLVV